MKITEALRIEHTVFCAVFDQVERALPSVSTPLELQTLAKIVESLLTGHAERETNLAYLALDHTLANKGELDRLYEEHHEIDQRLKAVFNAKTGAEGRRLLKAAIGFSREHFRMEEQFFFPLMENVLQPETLEELGAPWKEPSPQIVSAS